MKIKPLKLILGIIVTAILVCMYFVLTDSGGDSLGNIIDTIIFTSLILFLSSLILTILNWKDLSTRKILLLTLIISFPLSLNYINLKIKEFEYSRKPNLTSFYKRPVNQTIFEKDSINIQKAINSLIELKNSNTGGTKRIYAKIDTIIYSPNAKQISVIYMQKFEKNGLGNDLDPAYLSADKKNEEGFWEFEEGLLNAPNYSGSYHNEKELKNEVRKFYFNRYSFDPKEQNKENYFWK